MSKLDKKRRRDNGYKNRKGKGGVDSTDWIKKTDVYNLDLIEISSSSEDSDIDTRSAKRARSNGQKKGEEDFISLDTDTRNRSQRRYDEIYGSRKKKQTSESDDEEMVKKNQSYFPWMSLMDYDQADVPLSVHNL
jgi:hypothetical protein